MVKTGCRHRGGVRASIAALLILATIAPALGVAAPVAAQAGASASCLAEDATSLVGEPRWFCEPRDTPTFIQFAHFEAGLRYLEESFPERIDVRVIGESLEGRPIYFVEVTNEASPVPREEKLQIGYSASIHANEAAGREGMARVIEDLAAGIGPHGDELQALLDDVIVNVWFPNPDSWVTGDYFSADGIAAVHECSRGPVPLIGGPGVGYCSGFDRENAAGVDLNREFPNPGLIHKDHTPMSEPESQAVVRELRFSGNHSNLVAGMDLHGMINSPNMIRAIIPNQDYDFRRMVLAVDMLQTIESRVNTDPAFAEWAGVDDAAGVVPNECATTPEVGTPTGQRVSERTVCSDPSPAHGAPMAWGARWDMIGYTDTGFTSDYLMLSPRSPTGGMGAVGTITEFAYSHAVPDNKFVPKLTEMHVAGVRQMVRTQMELAGRLETPVMAGTGPVAFIDDGVHVTSQNDLAAYRAGQAFDRNNPETWFDFDQVDYNVRNLNFWRDLDAYTLDAIVPLDATRVQPAALESFAHVVITDQAYNALGPGERVAIDQWVREGGHLLLTDGALQFLADFGLADGVRQIDTYLGYSDIQDRDHPLVAGVTWDARVTGEGPAIGMEVGNNYPQWVVDIADFPHADWHIAGTTQGAASLGRVAHGDGTIDFLGGALPMPRQVTGENSDHRYGLADYSVSAFTYWIVMNSLGGELQWQPIDTPFVPCYAFDPLYGQSCGGDTPESEGAKGVPALPVALLAVGLVVFARTGRRSG